MNFLKRHVTAAVAVLLGLVTALLYGTILSHILIYMEQHRLFRFSQEYIVNEIHHKGWAKLAGDFVAQFFYYPWLGALVLGLLFALLYAMVADGFRRLAGRATIMTVLAGLVCPVIFIVRAGTIDTPIEPLMIALFWGAIFWTACFTASLVMGSRKGERKVALPGNKAFIVTSAAAVAAIGGAVAWNLTKSYDPMERTIVLIEEEYRAGDDYAVIMRADEYLESGGRVHVVPFFRNLSLLRQRQLAAHIFDYPPLFGEKSLYVPWDGLVLKREYGKYLFDLIGHVNEAQRWQSESMTNFGETGRNTVDLTAYNILNGRDRVARRGIRHLRQTMFYRSKADSLEAALGTGQVAGRKNFFAQAPDSLNAFGFDDMLRLFGYMNHLHPGDRMLQELFITGSLLRGDMNNFIVALDRFDMRDPGLMPRPYREALAMVQAHDPNGWWRKVGIKTSVADIERYGRFLKTMQSGNRMQLKSGFADTYWYYFNFINPDRQRK